ncbi:RIO-like kinase [Aspergillus oryzae]|uniref:non-specific serine/threonine protein kinase n=1 Tax=Aspergillus oryzae TaxID=5062 RepID=A0A1S9D9N8_ASPOZ|nr:RIO-like kinase [Aspergillus oryzae]
MPGMLHPFRWQIWHALWLLMSSFAQGVSSLLPLPALGWSAKEVPYDEEVLSLDLEENDFLYRIRRNSRIVYVSVLDGGILPPDYRTDGFLVLAKLQNIPKWNDKWKTLTVRNTAQGIESSPDEFPPHGLDLGQLNHPSAIFVNILDLTTVSRISYRLSRVRHGDETWVLKIARFKHEIRSLQHEVSVYSKLMESGFSFCPKFIGFVYEETKDRTIGFLMEEISGRTPGIQDLKDCTETVRLLHEHGIVHGDLNKYNFLVTEEGVKLFDFEVSAAQEDADPGSTEDELKGLAARLEDESGIGRRGSLF